MRQTLLDTLGYVKKSRPSGIRGDSAEILGVTTKDYIGIMSRNVHRAAGGCPTFECFMSHEGFRMPDSSKLAARCGERLILNPNPKALREPFPSNPNSP